MAVIAAGHLAAAAAVAAQDLDPDMEEADKVGLAMPSHPAGHTAEVRLVVEQVDAIQGLDQQVMEVQEAVAMEVRFFFLRRAARLMLRTRTSSLFAFRFPHVCHLALAQDTSACLTNCLVLLTAGDLDPQTLSNWSDWADWNPICSLTGRQYRRRKCNYGKDMTALGCFGKPHESRQCGEGSIARNAGGLWWRYLRHND